MEAEAELHGLVVRNTSRHSSTVALAYDLIFSQIRNLVELQMWLPKRNISRREKKVFFPLHMQDFKCDSCVNKYILKPKVGSEYFLSLWVDQAHVYFTIQL